MGRALSAPLALILFTLTRFTCALSAHQIASEIYIPRRAHVDNFVRTYMSLRDIDLVAGYCCDRFCFCTEVDNAEAEHCGAIEDRVATLRPSVCASASHNSSSMVCPPSGAGTLCNGGASCCTDSCIEPCTSKLDACTCPCNHFSCCKRLENQLCELRCRPCDKVRMMLDFQDKQGKPHSVILSQNFSLHSAESRKFYVALRGRPFIMGSFKPDDPNIVNVYYSVYLLKIIDGAENFPVGISWAELGVLTAFPILTVGVILTGLFIALVLQKMRRPDQRQFRIAWSVNRGLWMGIIWSLIILLLILQLRHPVLMSRSGGTNIDSILFDLQVLSCICWLPLLLLWLYHSIHPQL